MNATLAYFPYILWGAAWTVSLSLSSLALALLIGLCGTYGRLAGGPCTRWIVLGYVTLVRGVPELVWMFLLFYGGQAIVNALGDALGLWTNLDVSPFAAGVATIGIVFGAYMTETFRSGVLAIPKGQIEAALAVGLPRLRVFTRIIRPQLLRNALAGLTNNWLGLLKATALVSVIGLPDVVNNAHTAGRSTGRPFIFLLVALLVYLLLTAITDLVLNAVDRRNRAGGWRV